MKTKGRLSLTVVFLVLFLGVVIALEGFNNYISGANAGNISLTISSAPNAIILISPDGGAVLDERNVTFEYEVSSALHIVNCTLVLDGALTQANTSAVVMETTLNFSRSSVGGGGHEWSVNCTSTTNIQFNSSTRSFTIAGVAAVPPRHAIGDQPRSLLTKPITEIISTMVVGDIKANETKVITGFIDESGIEAITIIAKFVSDVKITIRALFDKPPEIIEPPEGYVYKYVSIDIPKITEDILSSAEITFKVEKNWLEGNSIPQNSIWLARFSEGAWQKLGTQLQKEDDAHTYYIAQTPGFSTFAIGAELPGAIAPAVVTAPPKEKATGIPKTPTLFFHLPSAGQFRLPSQSTATIMFITIIAILTIASVAVVAKSFEEKETQALSAYISDARKMGHELKAIERVLERAGWPPDKIEKAVWHHRLKKIFHREKKR